MIINANLIRKESEFRTKSCVVEKAIAVPHAEFDDLKRYPLRDNKLIAENADLMYCDSDDNYHCLLIYAEEQCDGLLIESEGTSYCIEDARISCGAFRLLVKIASLPPKWKHFTVEGLLSIYPLCGRSKNTIRKYFNELLDAGYIIEEPSIRQPDGTFGTMRYTVDISRKGVPSAGRGDMKKQKPAAPRKSGDGKAVFSDSGTASQNPAGGAEGFSQERSRFSEKSENSAAAQKPGIGLPGNGSVGTNKEYTTKNKKKEAIINPSCGRQAEPDYMDSPLDPDNKLHYAGLASGIEKLTGVRPRFETTFRDFCAAHEGWTIGEAMAFVWSNTQTDVSYRR